MGICALGQHRGNLGDMREYVEMGEGGEVLAEAHVPTDYVWMAQAAPDWVTGGAGFTQRAVGVCALLHQPSCTHTHTRRSCVKKREYILGTASLRVVSWKWHVSQKSDRKRKRTNKRC